MSSGLPLKDVAVCQSPCLWSFPEGR